MVNIDDVKYVKDLFFFFNKVVVLFKIGAIDFSAVFRSQYKTWIVSVASEFVSLLDADVANVNVTEYSPVSDIGKLYGDN